MITKASKMGIQWGYIVGYKDVENAINLSQVSHGTNRRVWTWGISPVMAPYGPMFFFGENADHLSNPTFGVVYFQTNRNLCFQTIKMLEISLNITCITRQTKTGPVISTHQAIWFSRIKWWSWRWFSFSNGYPYAAGYVFFGFTKKKLLRIFLKKLIVHNPDPWLKWFQNIQDL